MNEPSTEHGGAAQRIADRLATSERRLRLALDAGRLGTWDWDVAAGTVQWSATLEKIHGLEPGTFAGTFEAFQSDMHPDDRGRVLASIEHALETRGDYRAEYRIVLPDGVVRWLEARGRVLLDAEGDVRGMTGVCNDITERKAAEATLTFLAESTLALDASLDSDELQRRVTRLLVPTFADWCVIHRIKDGNIEQVAVAHDDPDKVQLAARLWRDYPTRADSPHGVAMVIRAGRREVVREIPDDMLVEAAVDEEHLEVLRSLQLRSYACLPLQTATGTLGAVTCVYGESGRRYDDEVPLIEAIVQRTAFAMENASLYSAVRSALQSRDQVLATVSHDLRSPLQSIATAADLLDATDDETRRGRAVDTIRRASQQASRLIDDLLDVSRMTAGKLELDLKTVAVAELLEELEVVHRDTAATRELTMVMHAADPKLTVTLDSSRALQLLGNLVSNAIKFTPRQGKIDVFAERTDEGVEFRVRDDGPGISVQDRNHLFEPYWRGSAHGGGAGLGLSIVRGLAEAHGARVWVQSEPGAGATFGVVFPDRDDEAGHEDDAP